MKTLRSLNTNCMGTTWSWALFVSWPLDNYLGLIWFLKPFNWGLFGFKLELFGRRDYLVLHLLNLESAHPNSYSCQDVHERRDDGHDNFHIPRRRLCELKLSATCFFFVCILASYEYQSHHDIVDHNFICLMFLFRQISARLVVGTWKVGGVRMSCGLQGKQTLSC